MSEVKQLALIVADFSGESKEELNILKNDVVTFIKDEGDVKQTFVLKICDVTNKMKIDKIYIE
eukprot:gene1845-986_t